MRGIVLGISVLVGACAADASEAPSGVTTSASAVERSTLLLAYDGPEEDRAAATAAAREWVETCGADIRLDAAGIPLVASGVGLPPSRGGHTWTSYGAPIRIHFRTNAEGYDARAIITHEIGHALWLGHSPPGVADVMGEEDTGVRHVTPADCRALVTGRWE